MKNNGAMTLEEYRKFDALGLAELVVKKEITPDDLMACALEMTALTKDSINAVAYYDSALGEKKAKKPVKGLFQGVPFLVKDLLMYPGLRSSMGSRLFSQNFVKTGSAYTKKIDSSGLMTFGNTTTSEFGLTGSTETILNGITKNPWDPAYSAAGSSGGSAAAVSSGIVPMAHASDGGGSIRYPASVCGLFGFKPSKDRCAPSMEIENILSQINSEHCITKTVRDSAAFLSVTEQNGRDAIFPPIGFIREPDNRCLRIGIYTKTLSGQNPDQEVLEAIEYTAGLCEDLGHEVIPAPLPDIGGGKTYSNGFFITAGFWLLNLVDMMEQALDQKITSNDLEPFTLELMQWTKEMKPTARQKALTDLNSAGLRMMKFAKHFDVLLCPTIALPPQKLGFLSPKLDRKTLIERTERYIGYTPIHNSPANGMCAMSVPLFWGTSGMPIGSHFAALPGREQTLISLAYQLESAAPWEKRIDKLNQEIISTIS
jgi:amidase